MKRDTCAKCGAIGEYRHDVGMFLCGSCAFDESFKSSSKSKGAKLLFKKYAGGAEEEPKPTGGAA